MCLFVVQGKTLDLEWNLEYSDSESSILGWKLMGGSRVPADSEELSGLKTGQLSDSLAAGPFRGLVALGQGGGLRKGCVHLIGNCLLPLYQRSVDRQEPEHSGSRILTVLATEGYINRISNLWES